MFIIAGLTPKIHVVDSKPVLCPVCGLAQAYYKRVDHYFNLFFIPLFRVKKGEPFIMCEKCERNMHEFQDEYAEAMKKENRKCAHCQRALHRDFDYCPFCGKPIP